MKALTLVTRYREGLFECDACLLVYDVPLINGATIGDDVRDVLDRRPNTSRIFCVAPFLPHDDVVAGVIAGSALQRAGATHRNTVVEVAVLRLSEAAGKLEVESQSLVLDKDAADVVRGDWTRLSDELRHGWLFCLFDMYGGLVNAPMGVHFSKASGKHADKFLRASSVLLSTEVCGALAFFTLAIAQFKEPRRIFVDTAPLISVALAMQRIAANQHLWSESPPVKSFSSYGGVGALPRLGASDLVLVSASTSGGLADVLVQQGVVEEMLVTLFFLMSSSKVKTKGRVACDLTYIPERTFGYPAIDSFSSESCALCKRGFVIAELEGDQFLIERRAVKRLRIGAASQLGATRTTLDNLVKKGVIEVRLHKKDSRRTDIDIDVRHMLSPNGHLHEPLRRLLAMFTPMPVAFVVATGLDVSKAREICASAGLGDYVANAQVIDAGQVENLSPIVGAHALVMVGYLCDHALLRGVNAQLRSKVIGGSVAYLSGLTIADSPRNHEDLRIFLQYGEHGPETFVFRSAAELMLPLTGDRVSPWVQELQLLRELDVENPLPEDWKSRITWLSDTALAKDKLFLAGNHGELFISPDFVLLDTKEEREKISQADVYAATSNALAAERCDKQALGTKVTRAQPTPIWGQSIYVQSVLCPSNFRDFNDAVLRAALLRAANEQELNYAVDEVCSEEMYEVIRADILAWSQSGGDSLPEFLMSMACGRLRLQGTHIERLKSLKESGALPDRKSVV